MNIMNQGSNSNKTHELSEAIRPWLFAFVVCNFNVDVGPEVEVVYPPDINFSKDDLTNICFSSFPERHETDVLQDIYFTFTLSNNSLDINLNSPHPPYGSSNLLFGCSIFRQTYDQLSKRSYNQKSLTIVSNHEFSSLFMNMLRILISGAQIGDMERLEGACHQIGQWLPPAIGRRQLPFMGILLDLDIPPYPSFPLQGLSTLSSAQQALQANISSNEPPEHWHDILELLPSKSCLYTLYERALLGLPIVILGQSPNHVSALVHAIIDLIRPIPYTGLVRPYLPMQAAPMSGAMHFLDASSSSCQTPFMIGVTNPFLIQKLQNVKSISATIPQLVILKDLKVLKDLKDMKDFSSTSKKSRAARPTSFISLRGYTSSPSRSTSPIKPSPSNNTNKIPEPIYLKPISFGSSISKYHSNSTTTATATHDIRRHFADLTARIIAPINRFLLSYPSIAASKTTFPTSVFVKMSLEENNSSHNVTFVGQTKSTRNKRRIEFYETLCAGENFREWLEVCVDGVGRQGAVGLLR